MPNADFTLFSRIAAKKKGEVAGITSLSERKNRRKLPGRGKDIHNCMLDMLAVAKLQSVPTRASFPLTAVELH